MINEPIIYPFLEVHEVLEALFAQIYFLTISGFFRAGFSIAALAPKEQTTYIKVAHSDPFLQFLQMFLWTPADGTLNDPQVAPTISHQ